MLNSVQTKLLLANEVDLWSNGVELRSNDVACGKRSTKCLKKQPIHISTATQISAIIPTNTTYARPLGKNVQKSRLIAALPVQILTAQLETAVAFIVVAVAKV